MNRFFITSSALVIVGVLASCGGKEVSSDADTVDVAVSVQPGTVAQNLTGDDEALGLINMDNVKFKYVIKGCKSGFKKDATANWVTKSDSVKLYKNDTGCRAELAAVQMNGTEFNKIFKKDNATEVTVSVEGDPKAASSVAAGGSISNYYFYKPSSTSGQTVSFVLKIPDSEALDASKSASVKFSFESIRSDLVTKNVQGVSVSQGLSIGALESPNFTLTESDLTFTAVANQKTVSGKTYYGFTVKAKFTCEDAATSKKIAGSGATATCATPGGDAQKLSSMSAVLVPGRTASDALTYDDAKSKFAAASAIQQAVAGAADGTQAGFTDVPWYQDSALTGGEYLGWLIVRMQDADSAGNKFESYTVFNVKVTN